MAETVEEPSRRRRDTLTELRSHREIISDDLLAHVAPLGWEHITFNGDYICYLLDSATIAELFAREGETASGHLKLAFKRAARAAFTWPEEAVHLAAAGRALTEPAGIGPSLARRLYTWFETPALSLDLPPIRSEFLTLAQARSVLSKSNEWKHLIKGDLKMHTIWSDGSGTISEMAEAAIKLGYRFIAITDHTKGLKIAGGLDEERLEEQGREIAALNHRIRERRNGFTILRGAEVNLSPTGEGDMEQSALRKLALVLGRFHSALRRVEDQTSRYIAALQNHNIQTSTIRRPACITTAKACRQTGTKFLPKPLG